MKKKIAAILTAAAMCAALSGCGGNTPSAPEQSTADSAVSNSEISGGLDSKTDALKEAVTLPKGMVDVKADTLKDRFGIEEADVAELSAYVCGSGAMPDEFGVFRAKDADAAKRVADALNKRIEQQRKTFKDYTPNEMYKFDDCFVEIHGNVVIYAVCADNSKAKELLK